MDQSPPRPQPLVAFAPEDRWARRRTARVSMPLWIAGAVSVLLHVLLGGSALIGLRPGRAMTDPTAQGAVELLMVERAGTTPAVPSEKPQDTPPPPATAEAPPTPRIADADPAPSGRPAEPLADGEAVLPPAPAPAPERPAERTAERPSPPQPERPAPPPAPQEALTFNFDGTDSPSNAEVSGDQIIPASPDDRFRNRPPVYPRDAANRGEHGVVVLVIHVSERGVASSADIAASSGFHSLDQAAVDAVRKWRFRPALKDGRAIPFDMPIRFVFEAD